MDATERPNSERTLVIAGIAVIAACLLCGCAAFMGVFLIGLPIYGTPAMP